MNQKRHSADTKAKVLAEYKLGKRIYTLSQEYEITPPTIRSWVAQAGFDSVIQNSVVETALRNYLVTGLEGLTNAVYHATSDEFLKKQKGSDVADIIESVGNQIFQLLASFQPSQPGEAEADSEGVTQPLSSLEEQFEGEPD